jgi:hypothetical protein
VPHYLLSIVYPAGSTQPEPAELEQIMARVGAVHDDLHAGGAWVFGGGLHDPSSATVVDARGGELAFTDGPYAETKEVVGGLTVITADDLDAALAWGGRLAEATGVPVEVRPFMPGAS